MMPPQRAAMLLSFKTEEEVLTRREIMNRAGVDDRHQFESLRAGKFILEREWRGAASPREYSLTPLGKDRREIYHVAENLHHG